MFYVFFITKRTLVYIIIKAAVSKPAARTEYFKGNLISQPWIMVK